jgi:hypothetical protein
VSVAAALRCVVGGCARPRPWAATMVVVLATASAAIKYRCMVFIAISL